MWRKIVFGMFAVVVGLAGAAVQAGVSYMDPAGGWTYLYTGDQCATQFDACLDGTWNHYDASSGGSDAWDGSAPGQAGKAPGGAGILSEGDATFLRIQDCGDPRDAPNGGWADPGNRKITFTRDISNEVPNAASILNDGVTLTFRARIPTTAPLDPIYPDGGGGPDPWTPSGYNIHDDGYGVFGIKQGTSGLGIICFSLAMDGDEGDISGDGLTMNKRAGTAVSANVDSYDSGGSENTLLGFDPTLWHEFWIQIVGDTSGGGTHKVTIWMDGDVENPQTFHVTAGNKHEAPSGAWSGYLAMSLGRTGIRGSQDVDFFGYKAGLYAPSPTRIPELAGDPRPADKKVDILSDTVLGWTPGVSAVTHDVYLGTSLEDVNNAGRSDPRGVLVSEGQEGLTYDPAGLAFGRTFFWRVDEVSAGGSEIFKGTVWSFTVESYGLPITQVAATASSAQADMGPENTVNGSGLNADDQHSTEPKQMWLSAGAQPNWIQYEFDKPYKLHELWVWNSNQMIEAFIGFGAKNVTIEHSLDGGTWTTLEGIPEFAKAPGVPTYTHDTTVDLGGAFAKYVRLTIDASWGGLPTTGLSEVRFFYLPVETREPVPADAATEVDLDAVLTWRAGREAASHAVYFGTDPNAVANGAAPSETVADESFTPAALDLGTTYYWKVDEVNEAMDPSVYPGAVWTFTTQPFAVVDDMESYNDDDNRIYDTWVDGLTDQAKGGSQVGYDVSPFAEKQIVHGGGQSLPLIYSNAGSALSEATLTFETPQDWTASGIKSLSLYFQGQANNTGTLYLKINNTKVAYSGAASDVSKAAWTPWIVDLSTVGGSLSSVRTLTIGVEGAGAQGTLFIDDIRLYPRTPEFVTPAQPDNANLAALYAFEGNTNDTSGKGLNGTIKQGTLIASDSPTGGSVLQIMKAGYVDLGNRPSLDFSTTDWTVTAWFKTAMTGTGDANKGTIYAKGGDSTGGHRYAIIMSETAEGVVTLITDDDVTKYVVDSKSKVNDGRWHSVAAQREGTTLRIYIDGQLEGSVTVPATYSLAGTSQHNAYIGTVTNHADGTLYKLYDGQIDDVRVYNRALTEGEILWLAGQTVPVVKPF